MVIPFPVTKVTASQDAVNRMLANVAFERALTAEAADEIDEALRLYREALQRYPQSPGSLVNLGNIWLRSGNRNLAEAYYREAIVIDPQYLLAHLNLAEVLDFQEDLGGAIAVYKDALQIDPRCAEAHHGLAILYRENGELPQSLEHWEFYVSSVKHNPPDDRLLCAARNEIERIRKVLKIA